MHARIDRSKSKAIWNDMAVAPRDGKAVRLLLHDKFGDYPFEPCRWNKKSVCWINAKTGIKIANRAVGWMNLRERQAVDVAQAKN